MNLILNFHVNMQIHSTIERHFKSWCYFRSLPICFSSSDAFTTDSNMTQKQTLNETLQLQAE